MRSISMLFILLSYNLVYSAAGSQDQTQALFRCPHPARNQMTNEGLENLKKGILDSEVLSKEHKALYVAACDVAKTKEEDLPTSKLLKIT